MSTRSSEERQDWTPVRFLTTEQVAQRLGLSQGRIEVLAREGRFPNARKLGRDWVIPARDVEEFAKIERRPDPRKKRE
jgi:excisionase family DNA binding protein